MEPNFHNNEYILVDMISYHLKQPKRGEVVVFKFPQKPSVSYIKRIIGVPNDCVTIENNKVYVNNHLIDESYKMPGTSTLVSNQTETIYKKCLSENDYFVMGDNREHSSDSREWGVVPRSNIVGRSWLIVYPLQYFGLVKQANLGSLTLIQKFSQLKVLNPNLLWR